MGQLADLLRVDNATPVPAAHQMPTWAGACTYKPFVTTAQLLTRTESLGTRYFGAMTLKLAARARVVCFDPETVEALPEWESARQVWDFCDAFELPADPCYLDFATPTAAPFFMSCVPGGATEAADTHIAGALVWRGTQDELMVLPQLTSQAATTSLQTCVVAFGDLTEDFGASSRWHGVDEHGTSLAWACRHETTVTIDRDQSDGRRGIGLLSGFNPKWMEEAQYRSAMVRAAMRALAALTLLEIEQAELAPVPLTRAEAKRAAKRGWPIADIVRFRRGRRPAATSIETRTARAWTHRWFVIGHTRHHPAGSRLGDVNHGRHLKSCTRVACAGMCRRVRVKSYIKGPDHLPLKPKTLIVPQLPDAAAA